MKKRLLWLWISLGVVVIGLVVVLILYLNRQADPRELFGKSANALIEEGKNRIDANKAIDKIYEQRKTLKNFTENQ